MLCVPGFLKKPILSPFAVKDIEKKKETSGKPKVKDVGKWRPPVPTEDTESTPFPIVEGQKLLWGVVVAGWDWNDGIVYIVQ